MLYPLKFKPLLKERIWGGSTLKEKFGKSLPEEVKIGESWTISGIEDDISVVTNGALAGNNLQELIEVYMGELVGDKVYAEFGLEFPLLIKLIDAQDVLSIQVHPNAEIAQERHNSYGKTELCYVVDAQKDAAMYVGFEGEVTQEMYLNSLEQGNLSKLLKRVDAKAGEAYFIPAGTIHAIGKGLLIAEIQQASDITYRVDDWGRVDADGEPRQLHTELAVDAIDFKSSLDSKITVNAKTNDTVEVAVCDYFTTNLVSVDGEVTKDYAELDSFVVYICIDGGVTVKVDGSVTILEKGECLLVPAQENSVELIGKAEVLEAYIK